MTYTFGILCTKLLATTQKIRLLKKTSDRRKSTLGTYSHLGMVLPTLEKPAIYVLAWYQRYCVCFLFIKNFAKFPNTAKALKLNSHQSNAVLKKKISFTDWIYFYFKNFVKWSNKDNYGKSKQNFESTFIKHNHSKSFRTFSLLTQIIADTFRYVLDIYQRYL